MSFTFLLKFILADHLFGFNVVLFFKWIIHLAGFFFFTLTFTYLKLYQDLSSVEIRLGLDLSQLGILQENAKSWEESGRILMKIGTASIEKELHSLRSGSKNLRNGSLTKTHTNRRRRLLPQLPLLPRLHRHLLRPKWRLCPPLPHPTVTLSRTRKLLPFK